MSKEFAEKNKNKKTPQEIKAEAQAKANSNPAPTKSAPKPTQNTTIVKPSQKKVEQVSAQTSSKSETKATPGVSLSSVKDKAKDYGKQFVEGVKKYATTSKAEKGQESTREKWAREAEEEQYKKSHPIKSIWEEATSGKSAKEVWQDVNPAIKTAGAVALPFLGGLGGAAISAMGLAKTFKDENNREVEIPTLESNDDVIDYYESLPDDNIVKRLVSQESRDNYRAKQQLSERYQEAKDSQMPELLENAGVSSEMQGVMGGINKVVNPYSALALPFAPANYLSQKQYLMEQGLSEADADYAIQYMNRNFDNAINDALVEKSGESTLGKIAGSEASIPARLIGSLEDVADKAINYATGKPLTTDGGRGARTMNLSRGFREEAQKDMGGVGRFLYGTGMSVLDMGAAIALAAATGGGSLVSAGLMGTQKASDVMDEAIKRGLTPDQIIAEGIASGVTTAVTEKIPMGKWEQIAQKGLTEVTAKQVGKMLFASAFPEAIQEMSEDGADLIADWLIAGDKSQINTDIARLMADNPTMSYKEASAQVWKDWAIQTALDGLGGFLSGGVMGGGSLAFNGLMNNNTTEIPGLMDDTQLSETELQELGYSPEEIAQYEAELRGEEMPTVDDAVADLIQNPVEDNVLNDEELLPLDLFENEEITNEEVNNIPIEEIANDVVNELGNPEEITNADVNSIVPEEQNAVNTANPETELFTDENVNESGDELASLVENELNNTPQNPNNDLASVMDSYVNEQQGNQDITQINPEDTYTSEDVTAEDLNNLENTDDVRERGYSDTVKNKTDAPPELKAAFINDPSLYRELHNSETQARANEIFDNGTLDESLARVQGMIDVKNPVAVPLAYRVSKELVSQGRTEEAVTLTRQLAQALTEAGQFTQAVTINMLNNDPIAGREYLERQIQAMNREGQMRFGDKWNDFSLTDEEIERFNNIDEGDIDAINEAYADVWARVARDYPVRMWDKLQELRRVGLLCNMRTFVRNTASNISMLPLRWNAGRITALAEYAYQKANPEYVRTESGLGRISKESRNLAQELYNKLENELFGEDSVNKYKEYNQATRNVQVFKGTKFDKALDKVITKGANLFINANNATLEYINKTTGGAFDEVMNLYGIENIDSLMNLINQKTAHKDINPSALETIRNFTYYMLGEFGDQPFIKRNFVQKLSSYIEANGIKSIEDIPQDAISLAVQEANKATFHDDSNIAQAIQGLRKDLNKLSGPLEIGNLILTFAKTPGNIGARMIEYSPIGLGKAAIDSVNANKAIGNLKQQIAQAQEQFDNAQNTQEKLNAQRKLEQLQKEQRDNYYKMTQALTLLGQGAEGTLGIAIGWLLNKMGFIVGHLSDDKKKRKYEQNVLNKQETSVQIGGTSYSIDFLQPSLSPVVFGAILSECFDKQTDSFLQSAGNAGLTVINSWLESTPMKSFSEMFSGYGTPAENIFNAIIDIPTSWIPSQIGASARIEDRTMRNTYDKTSTLNTIKNEAIAKIPGLSKTLPASYDLWGRERERQDTKGKAMFAQLLNPGTTKSENTTDIDEDILNLYDALNGDARVLPHSAATSYSIGGETHKLNNKEVSEYQKIMGQTSYELAKAYINSDAWDDADDEMKADELDKIYKFAESLAKREVLGVYPQDSQKNLDIYDDYGIDGVLEFFEIKRSINDGGMSRIEALDSMQLTAEEKGYYYSKLVSDPSENALAAQEEFGDAGLYYWYSVQEAGNKKAEKYQAIMDSDYDDDVKRFLIEKTYNDGRKNPVSYDEIDFDDINKAIQEIQPADPLSSHRNNNGYNLNSLSDNNEVPFLNRGNNNNADKGRLNLGAKPGVASLSNQESQTSEIPTLDDYDSKMITNGNAWVDAKSAIPYLDNSDMSDAQKGKILYENGKVSEKEQKAYDKGNYQGVKKYYDIKYYGDADGNGNIKKQELIDYLVGQGASKNEVNTWLDIYGFKANYNG